MVVLFLSVMTVSIFIFAWMYDKSIQDPIIETTDLEIKVQNLKNRIQNKTIEIIVNNTRN